MRALPFAAVLPLLLTACATLAHAEPDTAIRDLIDRGQLRRAKTAIEARAQKLPEDAETQYLLGSIKAASGDVEGALAHAEKAATLSPRDADYRYAVAELYGRKAQNANALSQIGLAKRFKKEIEAAIALDPKHVDSREALMEYYWQAPGIVGGDKKKAREMAAEIGRLDPSRGAMAMASIARREKQPAVVESLYLRAAALAPTRYGPQITLASWYMDDSRKSWDEALRHARAALAIDAQRVGAHAAFATIYSKLGRWDDLDRSLADAAQALPDNRQAHYVAGRTLVVAKTEPARAEKYLRSYLEVEPEIGAPSHGAAHWRLGLALEQQGRPAEAKAEIEKALALDPKLDEARKDLKRLKKG